MATTPTTTTRHFGGTAKLRSTPMLLTKRGAAEALSLSETEIDRLRRAGKLLARKHGNRVMFPVSELEKFIESLPGEFDE